MSAGPIPVRSLAEAVREFHAQYVGHAESCVCGLCRTYDHMWVLATEVLVRKEGPLADPTEAEVERVAKAIGEANGYDQEAWREYIEHARAAIRAMREQVSGGGAQITSTPSGSAGPPAQGDPGGASDDELPPEALAVLRDDRLDAPELPGELRALRIANRWLLAKKRLAEVDWGSFVYPTDLPSGTANTTGTSPIEENAEEVPPPPSKEDDE